MCRDPRRTGLSESDVGMEWNDVVRNNSILSLGFRLFRRHTEISGANLFQDLTSFGFVDRSHVYMLPQGHLVDTEILEVVEAESHDQLFHLLHTAFRGILVFLGSPGVRREFYLFQETLGFDDHTSSDRVFSSGFQTPLFHGSEVTDCDRDEYERDTEYG